MSNREERHMDILVSIDGCDDGQYVLLEDVTEEQVDFLRKLQALSDVKAGGCVAGLTVEGSEDFYGGQYAQENATKWADVEAQRAKEAAEQDV